jgi:hypothetical protein
MPAFILIINNSLDWNQISSRTSIWCNWLFVWVERNRTWFDQISNRRIRGEEKNVAMIIKIIREAESMVMWRPTSENLLSLFHFWITDSIGFAKVNMT